ncbi:MAG TPA: TIGR02466 family protein [Steroidobacteraceae bacterium]|nr:TIGR02466 family protein [Steroidobacteraceae bacterium]
MAVQLLFPTQVYQAALKARGARALNARLLRECLQLRADDTRGRSWSARHYAGGYTSYSSAHRMHQLSPTFAALSRALDRHVARFAHGLDYDLRARRLVMTDCWVNIMGAGSAHPWHLHPLSSISGTYYVRVPRGASGIRFEDPRLERFMAAPPRRRGARRANRTWVGLPARAGQLVLFESWLRHEVSANARAGERVSVSFNYNWF